MSIPLDVECLMCKKFVPIAQCHCEHMTCINICQECYSGLDDAALIAHITQELYVDAGAVLLRYYPNLHILVNKDAWRK